METHLRYIEDVMVSKKYIFRASLKAATMCASSSLHSPALFWHYGLYVYIGSDESATVFVFHQDGALVP